MAQLTPLPLTVSCFSKIQTGFIFLVPAHLGRPGQRAIKTGVVVVVYIHTYMKFITRSMVEHVARIGGAG